MTASRPFIVFLSGVFLSSIIFSPLVLDFTLTPRSISIAFALMIAYFLTAKKLIKVPVNAILLSFLAYVIFSWTSTTWAHTRSESVFDNIKLSSWFLVFLLSIHFFERDKEEFLSLLCKLSVVIFSIEFFVALFQILRLSSFEKESLYSVYALNSHKNLFSSFIVLQLPFIILCSKKNKGVWKILAIIGLVIYPALLLIIQTKAVWIGCLVSAFAFMYITLYNKIKFRFNLKISIGIGVILANLFFIFLLPKIIHKGIDFNIARSKDDVGQQKRELDQERLVLWDKTYAMFKKHSAIGVGAGNWQIYFPNATLTGLWRAEDLNYTFQRPHNDLLWILSETGLIGFNLFIIFIIALWFSFVYVIKIGSCSPEERFEMKIFAAVIPGFITASFFDFPKERIEHMVWFAIILAFSFHCVCKYLPASFTKKITLSPALSYSISLLCAFAVVCGAYRYLGEYHTRKMYDHKAQNNLPGVILEGKKAISFVYQLDPTSLPIKWYTGNAYALQNNFDLSQHDFIEALDVNPYNRNVLNDLGSSYAAGSDNQMAFKYYKESARVSPRFDDPKLNMAAIYIREKNYKAADSCLKTVFHDSERRINYQKLVNAFMPDENH